MMPVPEDSDCVVLSRTEDRRLLTGNGRFIHNIQLPDQCHAVFVRSPHAHARMVSVDTAAAVAFPGVIGLLTAADIGVRQRGVFVMPPFNPLVADVAAVAHPLLAIDEVVSVGQPVALVVGLSLRAAQTAADMITVHYEPRGFDDDADPPSRFGRERLRLRFQSGQAPAASAVAETVAIHHRQPRVAAMPLEPRAIIAQWHPTEERMTAWVATQAPTRARDDIARLLNLPAPSVRVITPDVGGAFGGKASVHPEDLLVCFAARHFSATIKWTGSRSEEFLAACQGRGAELNGELSVARDGTLLKLTAALHFPLGAWLPFSAVVPARNAARILPGPYRVDSVDIDCRAYASHTAAVNIYRGAGRPEAALLVERLVDAAARAIDLDPVELRLRALIPAQAMPWRTPTGECLDSGDYPALLTRACDLFGYRAERTTQARRRAAGERIGIGIGFYVEPCGLGWESARVTLEPDGRTTIASGSAAQGQGHETTFAAIAADALGCTPAEVTVLHGDTACCPDGIGALASRSTAIGGSAIAQAATAAAARRAAGEVLPLTEDVVYRAAGEAWSCGCVIVRLAVDPDTGAPTIERLVWVDDAGNLISPALAHGQLLGGLAQGIGQALMERIVHDAEGQLLTGSLLDYAVPRADDMPTVELHDTCTPSPFNLLGAKGVGEAGCIGVPAALLNAAVDALCHGAADPQQAQQVTARLDFPLTAERLWRALNEITTNRTGAG